MIKLYNSSITDILPSDIEDPAKLESLGYAINRALQRMLDYSRNVSIYANIDNLSENIIDALALELNTQYYDTSLNIETKRHLVKNTLVWYMSAGTPAAVEELIQAVFGEGKVKEWFEYGDDPYYFKITTNATMTPEMDAMFSMMLRRVKNTRSHIRAIEIHRTINQEILSGIAQHSNYKPAAIIDGYEVSRNAESIIYGGALSHAQTRPEPILDGFSTKGEEVVAYLYSGTNVAATTKQTAIMEGLKDTADAINVTIYANTAEGSSMQKPAAIMEGLNEVADAIETIAYTNIAEGNSVQKPAAIMEGLKENARPITQAIAAGVGADNSRYKNIITE